MRIITGKSKGRKLFHDRSKDLRPTSAKVREAVFNIVGDGIQGVRFLDLFAGTGAVAIEAASRGAGEVTCVEMNKKRCGRIKDVISSFGLKDNMKVICREAIAFLRGSDEESYDIIFADPPYNYEHIYEIIEIIYNKKILGKEGVLLVEHSSKREMPDQIGDIRRVKEYPYGDTMISRYGRTDE